MKNPFRYFKSSPEVIRLAVMMYIRFPLSLRQVEDLLHERGIDICHETVRAWWNRFEPMFAADKRAQAVVAGLMDLFAGTDRVETGRINDPDRHLPGDVGVHTIDDQEVWERVLEVRDKPVALSDMYLFSNKALASNVREAAMVAVSSDQETLDFAEPHQWAAKHGLALSVYYGWRAFGSQVLFWAEQPQLDGATVAAECIYGRIVELEISQSGANKWAVLVKDTTELS